MTSASLPQAQRERIVRDAVAVHAFIRTGVMPLLAAAAASESPSGSPDTLAAVAALRAHPTTRAALDGAMLDIQRTYEAGKVAWDEGRERQAAADIERARRAALALYTQVRRAVPAAARVLAQLAADLGSAAAGGVRFGLGLGAAVLGIGLVLALSKGGRK